MSALKLAPTVKLNNGYEMPVLGLGTYTSKNNEVTIAVKHAIDVGYRHIDTAYLYQNEAELGQALREKVADGTVKREDLFIVTKLWNIHHEPERVEGACRKQLELLGLDYIDLYLLHTPVGYKYVNEETLQPKDENGVLQLTDVDYLDTYKAMEKLVDLGLVRSLGVSNFNSEQIARVVENCKIKPVTNQVECSPALNQKKLNSFCKEHGLTLTAYSPLGRPKQDERKPEYYFSDKTKAIAEKHNKTPAQIILRYLVELGTIPIPRSSNPGRISENFQIFDFKLDQSDLETMESFHTGELLETEVMQPTTSTLTGANKKDEDFDPYVCSLSGSLKTQAKDELHEDDNIRRQALVQFREWIQKHPHIKKCRTDAVFLLRFLRTKKFSVPAACEMLERYLTIRQLFPQWFTKLDIEDPAISEIFDNGYLVPLPQRDEFGRQVIFSVAGKFDPYKFTSVQMARVHSLICEALLDEEDSQVAGYVYVNDESGMNMGFVSLWSLTDLRSIVKCIQNSTPMRHKETHFINIPHYANRIIELGVSMLSDKLKKRIIVHKSIDALKSKINPNILPLEYGGTVPMADMIKEFKEKLIKRRAAILALDDMFIEVTKDATNFAGNDIGDIDAGVVGSFRKLEVD